MSDEGKRVVLYFGLPNAMELLGENAVVATVRVQALEVVARVGNTAYRFHESILFEHVVPAKTKVRVKKDRVVVSMLKVFEKAYWESVSVNRRAVGPVRKSPPDHGRATTIYGSGAKK